MFFGISRHYYRFVCCDSLHCATSTQARREVIRGPVPVNVKLHILREGEGAVKEQGFPGAQQNHTPGIIL